jgi:DNA-binding CsgD family transcriptional regulator
MGVDDQEQHGFRTIARLIVAGHGDRYIAAALLVSERTLYRLLGRLMERYGLPNRAALGAFAASQGWLPEFPPAGSLHDPGSRHGPGSLRGPGSPDRGTVLLVPDR